MTEALPEIVQAVAQLPVGTVVDGEVVIFNGARLDFELLQQRLAGGPGKTAAHMRKWPVSFVLFDPRRPW